MFIRKSVAKNQDGSSRVYFQLAESVRVNGKPRNRVICTLGRADDPETEEKIRKMAESLIQASEHFHLLNLAEDLKADFSKEYGPFLVFRRLFSELGFEALIRSSLTGIGAQFDVIEALFNMMLNRLTDPTSKRQLELWEQDIEGVKSFSLHQYYRALDYLVEHKDEIEKKVFYQMRDLFNTELDIVLFDTTSLVYYGDGPARDEKTNEKPADAHLLDRGFSKAHRSDLPQVVVGVLMSKDGVPLGHEVFSGNTNDVKCFSKIIEQIQEKYSLAKVVLVGDRGMISKKNIESLEQSEFEYILGYRMRTISKPERAQMLAKTELRKLKNLELQFKEVNYRGQRLVVCYNPERAEKDKKHREQEVEKLREKLKSSKSVKQLISNPQYKKFIKIDESKNQVKLDEEKIKADEIYDGVFVLTTNTKLSALQVVERYKDLWQIEQAFRQLKSELDMGPIYHQVDRRIRAHIMICFLAFCMRVALYKKLKAYFKDRPFSFTALMRELQAVHAVGLTLKGKKTVIRTELKEGACDIFRAIGMRVPNRILRSEVENVVIRQSI
jgi:transposase